MRVYSCQTLANTRLSHRRAAVVGACPNRRGLTTHASALPISITDRMDAGNIEVDRIDGSDVQLRIKKDPFTAGTDNMAHSQWFHFK